MDVIEEARRVFDIEIAALQLMRDSLGEEYIEILNCINNCEGKLVITGMGKPGHVATKLAATFSSLGTPSFFLHPGEAMHGDLGMIDSKDIVFIISYSGESDEVIAIIPTIKQIGATIIGLTSNSNSYLAKMSDFVQIMPQFEEACHLKLAPTSSTTVEIVYGDSLAVTASLKKGFDEKDFGRLHPAGALGKKLIYRVSDVMTRGNLIPKVLVDATLANAVDELSRGRLSIVSIVDNDNHLLGIITDADFRRIIKKQVDIYSIKVADVMNRTPYTFNIDRMAVEALVYMREKQCNVLPIVDEHNVLVGTLHMQQIVQSGIVL